MNFPRLGVQNPQFTNAYEMERNAQANRPFSQLLNTGAKVIPAYIDQQKKEAEAQQLKGATNERNAFISNYGQGFVGGLTSPQSFMPKMTELDPTAANQLMDARKANAPKPVVASTAPKEEDRLATQWRALMATRNAKDFEQRDRATKERINAQISGLENSLSQTEYGKSLIGGGSATPIAGGSVTAEPETDQFYTPAVSAEIENLIGEFDNKDTETVEGVDKVKLWLAQLREKAGISESDPEYKMMVDYIGNVASGREQAVKEKRAEEDRNLGLRAKEVGIEQQKTAADQSGGAVDKREATLKIDQILANPNDPTVIADGVLWYVRKKSGAMIGPTEILQYMQGKLPQEKYNELLKELSPTGLKAIAGYVAGSSTSEPIIAAITAKYTPFIKKDRLINDINIWAQKKDLGKKTAEASKTTVSTAPKKGDKKTVYGITMTFDGKVWK